MYEIETEDIIVSSYSYHCGEKILLNNQKGYIVQIIKTHDSESRGQEEAAVRDE